MKKFFTLIVMALMAIGANAGERVTVWEGEQEMGSSWPSVAIKVADIKEKVAFKAGDAFIVTISKADNAINSGWEWGPQVFINLDWSSLFGAKSVDNGATNVEVKFAIEDEEMKALSAGTEIEIQGMNLVVSKVEVEVNEVIEYEATGTDIEFDQYGQIYKDQLADYSGNDKIEFTYKIEGSTDYEENGETKSVIGWGIGTISSLGGNVKVADLPVKGIGEYTVSFTMTELEAAIADTNTEYNTNGLVMNLWNCQNAKGSRVSIKAYKVKGSATATDTWTVAGTIAGSSWAEANTDFDMVSTDGVNFTLVKEDVTLEKGVNYEFKVVKNHAWDEAYPSSNYTFTVEETAKYTVTITFNAETKEITVNTEKTGEAGEVEHVWTVIGTLVGNWDVDTEMTKGDDGIYTATFTDVAAGKYEFKVRADGGWNIAYPGSNYELNVEADGSTVVVTFNPADNTVTATATVTDGITAVKAGQQNAQRYNLAGQKVGAGFKGIVIENGKKIVVK